jgi:RNA polymerase sigma factor (sigma-70 family)
MEQSTADTTEDHADLEASLTDPDRFGGLFDRHVRSVHRYFARRASLEDAEDLTATTFVAAFRARASYNPAAASPRAWLFGIATNQVLHHRRSYARRARALDRIATPVRSELATDLVDGHLDAKALIDAALALIGDELRDVVLLIGVTELTYAECADALRIPIGTVRSRYARARRELRALIGEPAVNDFALNSTEERTIG